MKMMSLLVSGVLLLSAPASAAMTTPAQVQDWAAQAIPDIMSFSYKDYPQRQKENAKYFTAQGHAAFYAALDEAEITRLLFHHHQTVSVADMCPPQVVKQTVSDDGPVWMLDIPLSVTYESAEKIETVPLKVALTVVYDQTVDNEDYLGISQWVAMPRDPETQSACDQGGKIREQIAELERDNTAMRQRLQDNASLIESLKQQLIAPAAP